MSCQASPSFHGTNRGQAVGDLVCDVVCANTGNACVCTQVQELQQQLDSKDKEARAHALAAKQAQRKMEEAKATAAKAVAGVNARVAEAVASVEALHKQAEDARVHLMLCIIREPGSSRQQQSRQQQQELQEQQVRCRATGTAACTGT